MERQPSAQESPVEVMGVMVGAPVMGYAVQTLGFAAAWGFVGLVALCALIGTLAMRGEEELSPGGE